VKTHLPSVKAKELWLDKAEVYTLPLGVLVERLKTDLKQGLSQKEADERQRVFGSNVIPKVKPSFFKVYIAPFLNWLISIYLIISIALAILAFFLVQEIWGQVIYWLAIIAVNALVTVVQEARAQTKLEALEKLSAPKSKVVREGRLIEISSEEIVPGDMIKLEQGDRVPADARIVEASNLRVNEASLTGESEEVEKLQGEMQNDECRTLSSIRNTIFLGTYITTGHASALVMGTGMETQIGKISKTLKEVGHHEILLRSKINKFAKYLALAILAYLVVSLVNHAVSLFLSNELFIEGNLNLPLVADVVSRSLITSMSIMPISIPLLTTIILITGVLAMAEHQVVIRDLNAVESLGRVSVVCSDKTGTITKDEMTVKWIFLPSVRRESQLYGITGSGFEYKGKILVINPKSDLNILAEEPEALNGSDAEMKEGTRIELLLLSSLLNNDSSIVEERVKIIDGEKKVICKALGEATDASLLIMFHKSKLDEDFYRSNYMKLRTYPFESKTKLATKIFRYRDRYIILTKGASESVLSSCNSILEGGKNGTSPLSSNEKAKIEDKIKVFSSYGFRIISFAFKSLDELPSNMDSREFLENDLIYLGFVSIIDPPREGVLESVSEAKNAGIKTVMITGDSIETGKSIAEEVGIFREDSLVNEGCNVDRLSNEEFLKTSVFARASPEHKLTIIDRYKKQNHIVAMTGDGVNDVLAISKADVGIVMGITGTDIAKEAADMAIADDSFNSIITGIREGRGLFEKIRSIIFFYVAVNLAEALVFFGSSFIPGLLLLSPSQHIFIILTTHSVPPLVFIIDHLSKDVMKEKPRDTEDIFTMRLLAALLLFSLSLSLILYLGYFGTLGGVIPVFDENKNGFIPNFSVDGLNSINWVQAKARTLLYAILMVAECTLVVSLRRMNKPISSILREDNYWIVWLFILIVPLALLVLMYIPWLQSILVLYTGINLELIQLTWIDWTIAIPLGLIPIVLLEFYKKWLRRKESSL
jgi:Ca2+-transporting ATPase